VIDHLLRVRVRITGTLPDPDEPRGMLVLSNHRSWLDPLLLIRFTRSNGLSKSEVRWIPFVGWMGRLTGAVFFDRRDPRDRQRARDEVLHLLGCGHRVQVFPEGTRAREERVGGRVYLNLVRDCWHQKIPVLCCSVWRTEAVLPPDFFGAWWGQAVELRVGKLLEPTDFPDARTFAAAAWAEVVAGIDEVAALPINRS
jgi:1-acyl-sn-glycerol-3-phosphate acyltransferase